MGISLLKVSLLCVKFYIHKIDSISVFVMKLKRILISAKGYLGGESLTTIIDKITWTNSELTMKMPLSPLFNVGDVSRRVSEFSTFIEGERGGK